MRPTPIRVFLAFCAMPMVAVSCLAAQTASAAATAPTRTPEQVYKNIQILKDIPADQLIPAMQFIAASLGVQCDFCHLENAFEKDDKETKQTARKMIQMVLSLNKDAFAGQRKVTCYACHRGARKPVITPPIEEGTSAEASSLQTPDVPALPNVDQILEKYLRAIRRAAAGGNISTRVQQGTLTVGAKRFPVEVLSEGPDKRLTTVHFPDGDNVTALTGSEGWSSSPGHPVREMGPSELDNARLEAELFAEDLRTVFPRIKALGTDRINQREVSVLSGIRENLSPVQLYLENESGLLVRALYYTETPLGDNPTQIDYEDYREQDGIRIPFRWVVSRPRRRFTIQIDKMQQGGPVDESKFQKPAIPPPH